jgi:hypothetical protein
LSAPLGLLLPALFLPAVLALLGLLVLAGLDVVRADPPRACDTGRWRFRVRVALLHLLQPLVRTWGRARHRTAARRDGPAAPSLPGPVTVVDGDILMTPFGGERAEVTAAAVAVLQRAGYRVAPGTGWEDFDARIHPGPFVVGELLTTGHIHGWVQLRVRRRPRWPAITAFSLLACLMATVSLLMAALLLAVGLGEALRELWWAGGRVRRTVAKAAR